MMSRVLFSFLLLSPWALASGPCQPQEISAPGAEPAIPGTLTESRRELTPAQMAAMRTHAWQVFDKVTAPSTTCPGFPTWRSWRTKDRAFSEMGEGFDPSSVRIGPKMDLKPPVTEWESVYFNPASYKRVRDSKEPLYRRSTATGLMKLHRTVITEFPPDSVVIKAFWRRIPAGSPVVVKLWNWAFADGNAQPEGNWRGQGKTFTANGGREGLKASDYFYVMGLQDVMRDGLECRGVAADCATKPGDVFMLIAMHIATKELPDWSWSTFWWKGFDRTDGNDWTCDNAQRPQSITSVWKNYSADTTVSFGGLKPLVSSVSKCGVESYTNPHVAPDRSRVAVYNPFIEASRVGYGTASSCIDCHAHASVDFNGAKFGVGISTPTLFNLEGLLRTDYLWSVAAALGK
jgi:hypothetical protein